MVAMAGLAAASSRSRNGGASSSSAASSSAASLATHAAVTSAAHDTALHASGNGDYFGFEVHNSYTEMTQKPIGDGYPWLGRYKLSEPHRESSFHATGTLIGAVETGVVTNIEFQWEIDSAVVIGQEALHTFNSTGEYTVKLKAISTSSGSTKHETEDTVYCKYVRRELRALADEDRELFFGAIEAVFHTPCDDGKRMWGDKFECIDTFVAVHQGFAGDPYCDHAHDGCVPHHSPFIPDSTKSETSDTEPPQRTSASQHASLTLLPT